MPKNKRRISHQSKSVWIYALTTLVILTVLWALAIGPDGFSAVNTLRLSRVLLAVFVGAALSASGCALQALLTNPLADPYIIGVSGGSAVGGTIALVFFSATSIFSVPIMAVLGAFFVSICLGTLFKVNDQSLLVLLVGVAVNAFAGAFITIVKVTAPIEKTQSLLYWLIGNISYVSSPILTLVASSSVIGLIILMKNAGSINLLGMGEEEASRLGVNTNKIKRITYLSVSFMVGVTVAFCGMIGFIGLIVPQLLRIFIGNDTRILLPTSALFGAFLLTFSDGLSRLSFAYFYSEIPAGAFTALIGAPIFVWILFKQKKYL